MIWCGIETVQEPLNQKYKWDSPLEALKQALDMEKDVTRRIKSIIDYCSAAEDHHVSCSFPFSSSSSFVSEITKMNNKEKKTGEIFFFFCKNERFSLILITSSIIHYGDRDY